MTTKRLSADVVKERFKEKKLELLTDYVKSSEKVRIKCFCGNIFETTPNQVFTGNTKSCGCRRVDLPKTRIKDITGNKFGKLTAIKITGNSTSGPVWLFKCDCGVEKQIPSSWITGKSRRKIRSCGCSKHKRSVHWTGFEDISGAYWHYLQKNAKLRKLPFNLTIEDAWKKFIQQNKKCALTGIDLNFIRIYSLKKKNTEQTASLDRIDSSKGYELDNIQWVHKKVNKIKMNLTQEELIKWCRLIVVYNEDKHS